MQYQKPQPNKRNNVQIENMFFNNRHISYSVFEVHKFGIDVVEKNSATKILKTRQTRFLNGKNSTFIRKDQEDKE